MQSSNLIKLAPTLSVEERYKIVVPDLHQQLMDEKPLISESERQAITHFENKAAWEEYTHRICMLQWATTLWPKDIEAERFRVFAFSLVLHHALERVLLDSDDRSISKEKRTAQFEKVKEYVGLLETQSLQFYAYKEAINKIEQELYGVPIFNEERRNEIAKCYEMVDELFQNHNEIIHGICENEVIKKCIKPIVRDMESYLVKKPIPDPAVIERIVDEVRQIAGSEVRMLER